jgi:hypothetical protein
MSIFQEMVDQHGFAGAYESVKRFVRKLRGPASPDPRAVIITEPGHEAQVDYGTGPTIRDPNSGKYRRSRLFVFTLGYSRKCVRLLTFQSSTRIWAELHERAFRKLGGAVKIIVPDNLGEGVLKPDIYDPTLNPLYRDVLAHYGAVAMPCRVVIQTAKAKWKAVSVMHRRPHSKGSASRIHGTTKRQVSAMFAEEKPSLLPLPLEPFRYYQYGERTVHLDGCVEVEAAYYSAPPGWISRKVQVQWDSRHVRLLDPRNGQLLREHLRGERGRHRIKEEDRPQRTPIGVVQLLARMATAGESMGKLSKLMHAQLGELAVRRIQGILSFTKKYGIARVEDACAAALEMEAIDYRFVRRYLERNTHLPLSLKQVDPLIRQLNLYRDLIEERTKDKPQS